MEENREEDLEEGPETYKQAGARQGKGKALRDVFDLQVDINGADGADPD